MICKKYGVDVPIEGTDKLVKKYSNMDAKEIINDLDSMREITDELFKHLDSYIRINDRKNKDKEMER